MRLQFFTQTLIQYNRRTKHNIVLIASINVHAFPRVGVSGCIVVSVVSDLLEIRDGLVCSHRTQVSSMQDLCLPSWGRILSIIDTSYLCCKNLKFEYEWVVHFDKTLWNSLSWQLTELHSTKNVSNVKPVANLWTLAQSMNIRLNCTVKLAMTTSSILGSVSSRLSCRMKLKHLHSYRIIILEAMAVL